MYYHVEDFVLYNSDGVFLNNFLSKGLGDESRGLVGGQEFSSRAFLQRMENIDVICTGDGGREAPRYGEGPYLQCAGSQRQACSELGQPLAWKFPLS